MKKLWFKRKTYGWGWYPATWQGWLITLAYIFLVVMFGSTIESNPSVNDLIFTFLLPLTLLTIVFIRIVYATGEKPKWQWGKKKK